MPASKAGTPETPAMARWRFPWRWALVGPLVAVLWWYLTPKPTPPANLVVRFHFPTDSNRLFTVDQLAKYNGTDPEQPLLLAILGEVYDVSDGEQYYGPSHGYHCFLGRDASAAFMTGEFKGDGLTSDVSGLTPEGLQSVIGWRDFYRKHEAYRRVGKLVERYYDVEGRPTEALVAVTRRQRDIDFQSKRRDLLLSRYKDCNSKSVMAESFFTVWCDADEKGPRYVREFVLKPMLPEGKEERRCVCARAEQFGDDGLLQYPDCGERAATCQRQR